MEEVGRVMDGHMFGSSLKQELKNGPGEGPAPSTLGTSGCSQEMLHHRCPCDTKGESAAAGTLSHTSGSEGRDSACENS